MLLVRRILNDKPTRREDVFTPATIPTMTFVERDSVGSDLVEHLRQRGRPICVEGPFRSGKSTLLITKVKQMYSRHIHIVCQRSTTFDQILLAAFDDLRATYGFETASVSSRRNAGLSGSIFDFVKAEIGGGSQEKTSKEIRVVGPQLTSRTLAYYAAAAEAPLIIDDAHKLAPAELVKLAEAMREWQALNIPSGIPKLIAISSSLASLEMARELIKAAPDLKQRLGTIELPMMTDAEISEIVNLGSIALNVDFSQILSDILAFSHGYPGDCQDFCSYACAAAEIDFEQAVPFTLTPQHFEDGIKSYLRICHPTVRLAFEQCLTYPLPGLPTGFASLAFEKTALGDMVGASLKTVSEALQNSFNLSDTAVTEGLKQLSSEDNGVLYLDESSKSIRFQEPIYLVYYKCSVAANQNEITNQDLVKQFMEIMSSNR